MASQRTINRATALVFNVYADFDAGYRNDWKNGQQQLLVTQLLFLANAGPNPGHERTRGRFDQILGMPPDPLPCYIFLGHLSLSRAFMDAILNEVNVVWTEFLTQLSNNLSSISLFVRSRRGPWREALIDYFNASNNTDTREYRAFANPGCWPHREVTYPSHRLLDIEFLHHRPDEFYLGRDNGYHPCIVRSGDGAGIVHMIDIDECVYDEAAFSLPGCGKRPSGYPAALPWPPLHPQNVSDQNGQFFTCQGCFRQYQPVGSPVAGCRCQGWKSNAIVQLTQYLPFPGTNELNIGVRALQAFTAGQVIGEYVGELVPEEAVMPPTARKVRPLHDQIYPFTMCRYNRLNNPRKPEQMGAIAVVSARLRGNWTRFINTAPLRTDWNVVFDEITVADRVRIVVRTTKDIAFGEQLIASYGEEYMKDIFGADWTGR